MTCSEIVKQYPNFSQVHAGGSAVAWRHDRDNNGYMLITDTKGPGIPADSATHVSACRYNSKDRLLSSRIVPIGQLEAWIDKQLGFK